MYLFAGPHIILRCYEGATTTHLPTQYLDDDGAYTNFLTHALSEIVKERQVTEPVGFIGVILDDIIGEHDRCTTNGFLRIIVCCSNSSEQAVIVVVLVSKALWKAKHDFFPVYTTKRVRVLSRGAENSIANDPRRLGRPQGAARPGISRAKKSMP